jgi:hypothetical protein
VHFDASENAAGVVCVLMNVGAGFHIFHSHPRGRYPGSHFLGHSRDDETRYGYYTSGGEGNLKSYWTYKRSFYPALFGGFEMVS